MGTRAAAAAAAGSVDSLVLGTRRKNKKMVSSAGIVALALAALAILGEDVEAGVAFNCTELPQLVAGTWEARSDEEVTELSCSEQGAVGAFPGAAILNLTSLIAVDLSENALTGVLPADWSALAQLTSLKAGKNSLSGPLPEALPAALEMLSLAENELTGTLPSAYGDLASLHTLVLSKNQISGPIPAELGSATGLLYLTAIDNALTGQVPSTLALLTSINTLDFSANRLSGCVGDELVALCDDFGTFEGSGSQATCGFVDQVCGADAVIPRCADNATCTASPTASPTTAEPSASPTAAPSQAPSSSPTASSAPTAAPTANTTAPTSDDDDDDGVVLNPAAALPRASALLLGAAWTVAVAVTNAQ